MSAITEQTALDQASDDCAITLAKLDSAHAELTERITRVEAAQAALRYGILGDTRKRFPSIAREKSEGL